jgi:hypothetical protein
MSCAFADRLREKEHFNCEKQYTIYVAGKGATVVFRMSLVDHSIGLAQV